MENTSDCRNGPILLDEGHQFALVQCLWIQCANSTRCNSPHRSQTSGSKIGMQILPRRFENDAQSTKAFEK